MASACSSFYKQVTAKLVKSTSEILLKYAKQSQQHYLMGTVCKLLPRYGASFWRWQIFENKTAAKEIKPAKYRTITNYQSTPSSSTITTLRRGLFLLNLIHPFFKFSRIFLAYYNFIILPGWSVLPPLYFFRKE